MASIYFDLDGTLVAYTRPFDEIYGAALSSLGVEPTAYEAYTEAFFDALGAVDDPYATAIGRTDVDVDPTAFADAMVASETASVRAVDGAAQLLDDLANDDAHRIGVLTNGVGRLQRGKLAAAGLVDWFAADAVVVSDEVGAWKPDADIYRTAESRLPADEHVFVADEYERDVAPAVECGWRGVLLDGSVAESVVDSRVTVVDDLAAVRDAIGSPERDRR